MSGYFRSRPMQHYNLLVPRESAWEVMNELGCLDSIHWIDYDPALPTINRPFANHIKRYKIKAIKV
jgi:V-type H+-transporting ATPase subunit a